LLFSVVAVFVVAGSHSNSRSRSNGSLLAIRHPPFAAVFAAVFVVANSHSNSRCFPSWLFLSWLFLSWLVATPTVAAAPTVHYSLFATRHSLPFSLPFLSWLIATPTVAVFRRGW
jgi:uncharacterized membrane protein YadS